MTSPSVTAYEFGAFRLEPPERRLLREGPDVPLPPKAFDLLVALVSQAGRLVTREALLQDVWPDTFVEEANLSYTVSLVRKALDEDSGQRHIDTVQKRGYRFRTPVLTLLADLPRGEVAKPTVGPPSEPPPTRSRVSAFVARGLAMAAIGVMAVWSWPRDVTHLEPPLRARFDVAVPDHIRLAAFAFVVVSPDGKRIAFAGISEGKRRLWVRSLDSAVPVALPGTDDAIYPFWSPDSSSLGFFAQGKLKKTAATGGPVLTLCDAPRPRQRGGAWGKDGVILFSAGRLYRVSETGGVPEAITELDSSRAETEHRVMGFLSDGLRFVFSDGRRPATFYAASLAAPLDRHVLLTDPANDVRDVAITEGYLVYGRRGTVTARALDEETLQLRGEPITLADGGWSGPSASRNGIVVFRSLGFATTQLTWVDRTGKHLERVGAPDSYLMVELSPTGTRAALVRAGPWHEEMDLWLVDLASGAASRLTTYAGFESDPIWSPDERRIAYSSTQEGMRAPFTKDLVTGREARLVVADDELAVDDWTPDGRFVIVRSMGRAVFAIPLVGERKLELVVDTPFLEDQIQVSPSGEWAAMEVEEGGSVKIHVARLPGFTDRTQVSLDEGRQPRWRGDGRELFYLTPDSTMMVVEATPQAPTGFRPARPLFKSAIAPRFAGVAQYDVTADGRRFLILEPVREPKDVFTYLLNWTKDQKK